MNGIALGPLVLGLGGLYAAVVLVAAKQDADSKVVHGDGWFDDATKVAKLANEWDKMNRRQFLMTEGTRVYEACYARWGPMKRWNRDPWPQMPNDNYTPDAAWTPSDKLAPPPY